MRRDVPVWVLPGGGIELNETPEQAVVREILEETGLTVKVDRLVGSYYPANRLTKRTLFYECVSLSGELTLSDETRGVKFTPLQTLPAMPPPYRDWIADAIQREKPITKTLHSVNYLQLVRYLLTHPILVIRFLLSRIGLSINSG